jgi:hypothetical protein
MLEWHGPGIGRSPYKATLPVAVSVLQKRVPVAAQRQRLGQEWQCEDMGQARNCKLWQNCEPSYALPCCLRDASLTATGWRDGVGVQRQLLVC